MSFPLRATMQAVIPLEGEKSPAKVVISVSKKRFKRANKRNILKRRMREAYRHHKGLLYNFLEAKEFHLNLSINYITNDICEYEQINKAMEKLINKINKANITLPKGE